MARYFFSGGRDTTESRKKVNVFWLRQSGLLKNDAHRNDSITWSRNGEKTGNINIILDTTKSEQQPYIRFIYGIKECHAPEETRRHYDYKFNLLKTNCFFGGFRWWFECGLYKNNALCGKRVGILYECGDYFGCRKCANLSYESCNENKQYRSGVFRMLSRNWKADEYYTNIKRQNYSGKPTRKFRKYLKLRDKTTDVDIENAMRQLLKKT